MNSFLSKGLSIAVLFFGTLSCFAQKDSIARSTATIKVAANPSLKGSGGGIFFTGRNYRKEWSTKLEVPVLNLSTAYGGLKPTRLGGGKQTKSLRVESADGKEWALRSVEKFPEKAVPPELRGTVAAKIVAGGISGSYPYAILSMPPLSKAAKVLYLKDSLVYIGDDAALGEYRDKLKNTLVLMEERNPSGFIDDIDGGKKEKTISTEELVYKIANDKHTRVDPIAILRARLLDNFIMDFDRHQGQWDWVGLAQGDDKIYYPIPLDRDQAFYRLSGGFISKFVKGKNALPQLEGFKEKAKDITRFNNPEQGFDRYFLNSLSEEDWNKAIDEFLNAMTDDVIETALRQQPKELRQYSVENIITTLKNKRKYFKDDMMKYYRFISKTVSIVGTNRRELITISKDGEGKVAVVVSELDEEGHSSHNVFERVFDPAITRELRIYGLEGDDKFELRGEGTSIKTRLIGGPGQDEFINNSKGGKTIVYDVSFEQNSFSGEEGFRKKISSDPQNNSYNRLEYLYKKSGLGLSVEYTVGGLFLGPRFQIITQNNFRKAPFSAKHLFVVTRSLTASAYHLKYYGEFIHVFGKTDLLFHSDAWLPTSRTFFFGMGNNTVFDKTKPGGFRYYFNHYNLVEVSLMARNRPNSWFEINYGPVFQYFKLRQQSNVGKYITEVYPPGETTSTAYIGKSYAGGALSMTINTKNSEAIPTRGIKLKMYDKSYAGLSKYSNSVTEAGGQLDLFTDFIAKKNVVIATSFGASHILGDFEIQQAQYLGFRQNLRGFQMDRFAGRTRAYNNSEIRFMKRDANLGLFRGSMGLLVFNDIGRVWADDEESTQWHDGYGWGVFIAPLDKVAVTATLMYSKEQRNLFFVNFGFQF